MLSLEVPIRLNSMGIGQGGFEVLEKICKKWIPLSSTISLTKVQNFYWKRLQNRMILKFGTILELIIHVN